MKKALKLILSSIKVAKLTSKSYSIFDFMQLLLKSIYWFWFGNRTFSSLGDLRLLWKLGAQQLFPTLISNDPRYIVPSRLDFKAGIKIQNKHAWFFPCKRRQVNFSWITAARFIEIFLFENAIAMNWWISDFTWYFLWKTTELCFII